MKPGVTTLERAFELARSGQVRTVGEITIALSKEGYRVDEVQGRVLRQQLRNLISESRPKPPA